jgi:hypothetical protein
MMCLAIKELKEELKKRGQNTTGEKVVAGSPEGGN